MKLYTYFRSSAAFRVRIALNLKGLAYEPVFVHLAREGGQHLKPEYREINPQRLVPVLEDDDGRRITQSLAIIEYLDETHPDVPLLPRDAPGRARVRALAQAIACDIHPVNNLRVLKYLTGPLGVSEEQKLAWTRHWIAEGLSAIEVQLAGGPATGRFCHGDAPSLADCCLVPQVFNARRFDCDLSGYPTIMAIHGRCMELEAFLRAAPGAQPDAQ
ncbi:MAG: maleylacetoacetate isomerase [Betaproteobacteria bacterium]|nr:maleylacetoacetate isomerase [Betaproteobacteria bacterium]